MNLFILCLCFTASLCGKFYQENTTWGQPCLEDFTVASPHQSAEEVVRYSKWILEQLDSYKDEFIQKFEHLETLTEFAELTEWGQKEWLREFYWYIDEILPKEKLLGKPLPAQYIKDMKARTNKTNDVMPKINAALKFLEGSLYKLYKNDSNEELKKDVDMGRNIGESIRIIRSIICSMSNYMKYKYLEIHYLLDDFLPDKPDHPGVILRDIYNYIEYIKQLFETLPDDKRKISIVS